MYSTGDQIIHPRYGAGTVIGKKKLTLQGKTRAYHIVELVGARGEVMIPVDWATEMNIRPAIEDLSIIEGVFADPPCELSDDYRARQAKIQKQIQTREPEAMAEALRRSLLARAARQADGGRVEDEEPRDQDAQPRDRCHSPRANCGKRHQSAYANVGQNGAGWLAAATGRCGDGLALDSAL
jgi:RNA polymerase-interacting CarD/CdnL/TRCF family regulator